MPSRSKKKRTRTSVARNKQPQQSQQPPAGQTTEVEYTLSHSSGPIPSPDTLRDYDKVVKGLADRIVTQFEKQTEHRHSVEQSIVAAQIEAANDRTREVRRGQFGAITLGTLGIGGAVLIAWLNPTIAGAVASSIVGGGTLGTLATALITGRHLKSPDQPTKSE